MTKTQPAYSALHDRRIIRVGGRDAQGFLHAQLTQDLLALGPDRSASAAWLDAKGRVLATMEVVPDGDAYLLLVAADGVEALVARLRRYVLRADVELAISADAAVYALVGDLKAWLADRAIALPPEAGTLARADRAIWIRAAPDLAYVLGQPTALEHLLETLAPAAPGAVERTEMRLGRTLVGAGLAERYVAQMLDLDRLGAIAFAKGCYPGQEVVARIHNLGAVKRRLARFSAAAIAPPAADTPVTDATGADVGEVVRSAAASGGAELLAVVRVDALAAELFLPAGEGPPSQLARLPLPGD